MEESETKESQWIDHVEAWKESGKSRRAYSKEQRINLSTFNTWVSRYRKKVDNNPFEFVAVPQTGMEEKSPTYSSLEIREMLPATVTIGKEWLDSVFSFSSIPGVHIPPNIWADLFNGMKNGKKIFLWYKAPGYDKGLKRTLSPYHLFCNDAQWYVIGHDSYSEEIRLFALHRIEKIELTDFSFSIPEDFNYRNYIDAPLGMFIDEDVHNVELLFSKEAAPYIWEREWHPEQTIEEAEDNGIILKFQTRQLTSVLHWVLSWGGSVKVLSPDKMVNMVKESLSSAMGLYK